MTAMEKMHCSCHGVNFSAVWQNFISYTPAMCTLHILRCFFFDHLPSYRRVNTKDVLCVRNNNVVTLLVAESIRCVVTNTCDSCGQLCWCQGQDGGA